MSSIVGNPSRMGLSPTGRMVIGWLLGVGLPALASAAPALSRFEFTQTEMAVPIRIVLYAPDNATASQSAQAGFLRFHELNAVCSDYDPQSELRRLCDTSSEGKVIPVSDDLWRVLVRAEELSQRSQGAFDVTVGPLVHLWRNARHTKELPSAESLAAALLEGRLPLPSPRPQAARRRVAAAEDAAGPGRDRQGLRGR